MQLLFLDVQKFDAFQNLLDDRCENFFRDKTGVLIDFICNVNEISQRPEIHHFQDYVDLSLLIVSAEAFDQVLALVTCQQHLKVVQHLVPLGFFVDADFLNGNLYILLGQFEHTFLNHAARSFPNYLSELYILIVHVLK